MSGTIRHIAFHIADRATASSAWQREGESFNASFVGLGNFASNRSPSVSADSPVTPFFAAFSCSAVIGFPGAMALDMALVAEHSGGFSNSQQTFTITAQKRWTPYPAMTSRLR